MSELDDLEEIVLTPNRSGSAKRIRAGRKNLLHVIDRNYHKAKWKRQLTAEAGASARHREDAEQ